jgi:hypothetical protein
MIIFFGVLLAGGTMLIMRTSRYRPPFDLAPEWRASTVATHTRPARTVNIPRHRLAPESDRDWAIA